MVIFYLKANDVSGKYRWWTRDMELVGQFEHADSLDEVKQSAIDGIQLVDRAEEGD